jgi:predicted nucleic acid-binding protein
MRQRIYIDTSVFGGYFDDEFASHTIPLFDRIENNDFTLLFSTVTQDELENAPDRVKDLVKKIQTANTEFLDATDEAIESCD